MRLKGRCVLVVEDEYYLAKDVRQTLKAEGAEIMGPFSSHGEALSALTERTPDCGILDVNLGQGASFELADDLRARGVPFLFFTGYDREVIPSRFADVPRLEKPVDTSRIVNAAVAVCQGRASAVSNMR